MGKLVIQQHLINEENAKTLAELCPFGAISYEDGKLDEVECDYLRCPHFPSCPIIAQLSE